MAGHPRGTGRLPRDDRHAARVSAGMHVEKHLLEQKREGHVLEDEIPWGSRGEREKREADDAACATWWPRGCLRGSRDREHVVGARVLEGTAIETWGERHGFK